MLTCTRPFTPGSMHPSKPGYAQVRFVMGPAAVMAPLPVGVNGVPFQGMDPSNPPTWVRPWNPQPGMIAYLNFDGAAQQGHTPTGTQRNRQRHRGFRRG